ncbi:polyprenyl synthetase family protein [Candidatus Bathyarchaeota archaeon]|nr:polyprenyl synthetase family protein [Candidatus Bathyarchaeota archaeon]
MKKEYPYLDTQQEKLIEEIQKLMEERGRKPLEMARKAVLEEKIECKEAKEALHYFITEYWHDLARPTLLSICCEAVGGDPNATIPFAVPLSLISGALDIHDDIIDQSKTKHGRPTVYGKYGKEIALLTADALLFKGFTLLQEACMKIPKRKALKIMKTIKDMFYELGDAEAQELKLRGRLDITPEEYLRIIEKKAADVEAHTRTAAIIGNATKKEEDSLGKYGRSLGKIIIIRDEIIDALNTRELKHRIKREHLPLPVIYVMANESKKPPFNEVLLRKNISENLLKELNKKVSELGGFKYTYNLIEKFANCGLQMLKEITFKKVELKNFLKAFTIAI